MVKVTCLRPKIRKTDKGCLETYFRTFQTEIQSTALSRVFGSSPDRGCNIMSQYMNMKETEKAFLWIVNLLEQKKISYRISGGFAGRVYGVKRELADIDIQIADEDFSLIKEDVKPYVIFGPARYQDENWDLNLITLEYLGQEIDLASTNALFFNQNTKLWEKWVTTLDDFEIREVYNKKIPIEPLQSFIAYKTKLAREVDLEDVRQLKIIITHMTEPK